MTDEVRTCPKCGAYVMRSERYCARCDHQFDNNPPPPHEEIDVADLPTTVLPEEVPAAEELVEEQSEKPDATSEPASDTAPETPQATPVVDEPDVDIELDTAEREQIKGDLANAAAILEMPPSELPTAQFDAAQDHPVLEPPRPVDLGSTHIAQRPPTPIIIVPPAPYTPPPPLPYQAIAPTTPPNYVQQRVQAYVHGGYEVLIAGPYEATLSLGKSMGMGSWILALLSIIGLFWYLLLLALSGFQADRVYLVTEPNGQLYEDGAGAAHVRHARSRVGRRWSIFGGVVFVFCLLLALGLGAVAGIVLTQERYQAALREAYPAVTLFEETFSATEAAPDDVQLAKDGAVAFAILAGVAVVGLWGGATLFVIGTIHASAYRVHVPALPGMA